MKAATVHLAVSLAAYARAAGASAETALDIGMYTAQAFAWELAGPTTLTRALARIEQIVRDS